MIESALQMWPGLKLARELELAEAASCRAFALAAARVHPELSIQIVEGAGGVGVFYEPGDPLNAVKGVGLSGAVSPEDWDAVERVFLSNSSPVVVDLSPLADESLINLMAERGYRIGSFEAVTCRALDSAGGERPAVPGLTVGPPESPEEFSRVVGMGFANGGEPMKFAVDIGRVRATLPHAVSLLARVDGVAAGGASMSISGRVAHMNGAAVLPEFRGRGIQAALTAARLAFAQERGCVLAKLDVHAGSGSHRNAHRAGFRVAYTRPQMVRPASNEKPAGDRRAAESLG